MLPEITENQEINNRDFIPLDWAEGHLETASLMIWHNDKWLLPASSFQTLPIHRKDKFNQISPLILVRSDPTR